MPDDAARLGYAIARCENPEQTAILFDTKEYGAIWVPVDNIHDDSECFDVNRGYEGELVVKQWFAEKKGWA